MIPDAEIWWRTSAARSNAKHRSQGATAGPKEIDSVGSAEGIG